MKFNLTLRAQSGSVVIEFILAVPVLLFILGYSLRTTQLLQANQIAMTISREAATEAFRRCSDYTVLNETCGFNEEICINTDMTKLAANSCLSIVREKYLSKWSLARPTSSPSNTPPTIELEVYRHGIANFDLPTNCSTDSRPTLLISATQAELDNATPPITQESICKRNRVARSRISFTLKPAAVFLSLIPGFKDSDITITDETIL